MTQRHRIQLAGALIAVLLAASPAAGEPPAVLALDVSARPVAGTPVKVPALFATFESTVTALVFSIDLDASRLLFDPTDSDGDGVPDAVELPEGRPSITFITYDPEDDDGEIDIMLANLSGAPLPEGVILEFTFEAVHGGRLSRWLRYSEDPSPSFGNAQGQNVGGIAIYLDRELFADGFESGDTSAWTRLVTPP